MGVDLTFKETVECFQSGCTTAHATSSTGEVEVLYNHDESLYNNDSHSRRGVIPHGDANVHFQ